MSVCCPMSEQFVRLFGLTVVLHQFAAMERQKSSWQSPLSTIHQWMTCYKFLTKLKFLNGLLYCPPDLFVFNASPNTRFSILVNLLYLFPEQQLILTHFLLVLLDCGTVYQQIMYIMTLLDNLKSVLLSFALKFLHLS